MIEANNLQTEIQTNGHGPKSLIIGKCINLRFSGKKESYGAYFKIMIVYTECFRKRWPTKFVFKGTPCILLHN